MVAVAFYVLVPAVGLEPTKPLACEASALPTELSGHSLIKGREILARPLYQRQAK